MKTVHWCTQSETIRNRIVPTKVFEKYSLSGFLKHDYLFSTTLSESQKPAFDLSSNVVCFEISWYSWARERPAHWQHCNAFTIVASRPRRVVSLSGAGAAHSVNQYLTIHFTVQYRTQIIPLPTRSLSSLNSALINESVMWLQHFSTPQLHYCIFICTIQNQPAKSA